MADSRDLPAKRNPLLMPEHAPKYDVLVDRRRLGQTDLQTKASPAAAAAKAAKQPSTFDYAHLRAPLPKNLVSEIFRPAPASYFLMRRSSDGYVSATGMFKATFPYATVADEEAERNYIKSLETTSEHETAGNVWISPEYALELAEEYGITMWIRALLDPTPIEVNAGRETAQKKISPPPAFTLPPLSSSSKKADKKAEANGDINPKTGEALRRSRRSVSPVKSMPPATKRIATPRKSRKAATVGAASSSDSLKQALHAAANATESSPGAPSSVADTEQDNESIVSKSDKGTPVKFKAGGDQSKVSLKKSQQNQDPKVVVHVDQDVKFENGEETTHTHVEVEMPEALFAPMPKSEDTASLIAEATKMVEAAVKANNMTEASDTKETIQAKAAASKRKADEIAVADDEDEENQEVDADGMPVVKRARVVERDLKKEKVKTRALIGISATLAIGALIPYVFGAF